MVTAWHYTNRYWQHQITIARKAKPKNQENSKTAIPFIYKSDQGKKVKKNFFLQSQAKKHRSSHSRPFASIPSNYSMATSASSVVWLTFGHGSSPRKFKSLFFSRRSFFSWLIFHFFLLGKTQSLADDGPPWSFQVGQLHRQNRSIGLTHALLCNDITTEYLYKSRYHILWIDLWFIRAQ